MRVRLHVLGIAAAVVGLLGGASVLYGSAAGRGSGSGGGGGMDGVERTDVTATARAMVALATAAAPTNTLLQSPRGRLAAIQRTLDCWCQEGQWVADESLWADPCMRNSSAC